MDVTRWITLIVLTLLLAEGFALSVFPDRLRELLADLDPRTLQLIGLIESIVAAGLIVALLLRS